VEEIQDGTTERLKARVLAIALGKEKEVKFVGKEGRKEIVNKDGQTTLRWLLEALEPMTFNQKAMEARGRSEVKDPVVIMPAQASPEDLKPTHRVEEESA